MRHFIEPTKKEKSEGMITKNAVQCGICGGLADRYSNRFECSNNPNHVGDLNVGIFSDLTHPSELPTPEDSTDKSYNGFGKLHLFRVNNEENYFVLVGGRGRGKEGLLFSHKELENARLKYLQNRKDIPEPKTFWGILLSGELWRLIQR